MAQYEILDYIVETINNNYTESIEFNNIDKDNIDLTLYVSCQDKIQPVLWMIEANMITKRELAAKNAKCNENVITIETFSDITYKIKVESLRKK